MLCTACALCHVLLAYMYFVTLNHVSRSHLLHATGLSKTSSSPPRLHPPSSLHFYYLLLYYLTLLPTLYTDCYIHLMYMYFCRHTTDNILPRLVGPPVAPC